MTFLYLSARYLGMFYAIISLLISVPTIPVIDAGWVWIVISFLVRFDGHYRCRILYITKFDECCSISDTLRHHDRSTTCHVSAISKDANISRYHLPGWQHFQRSDHRNRNRVYFNGYASLWVKDVYESNRWIPEALILSGTYQCMISYADGIPVLDSITWIFAIVWEVLVLCLAVWIAVKHFCELRRHSAGGIIGDCFTALMRSHVIYFSSFIAVLASRSVFCLRHSQRSNFL